METKPVPIPLEDSFLELSKNDKFDSYTVVRFNDLSYFPYMLKRQFTELDFIAYTGGAFGLFLGISIMSFVEIFYYFTIRLFFNWIRKKRKDRKVRVDLSKVLDKAKSRLSYVAYYSNVTTVHGISQIIMPHRTFIERIFWSFCLGFSLFYCGTTCLEMYQNYDKTTIAITYDSDERSIEEIPFPAVSITPEILLPHIIVRMAWNLHIMRMEPSLQFEQLKYFGMLNRYLVSSMMCNYLFALDLISVTEDIGIDNFVDIMEKYSMINWFEKQSAVWDKKFRPEFVQFLGKSGYGFLFNMVPPKNLFRENVTSHFNQLHKIVSFNISELSKNLEPITTENYPLNARERSSLKLTFTKNRYIPYKSLCQFPYYSVHSPFEFPGHYEDETSNKFYYGQDLDVLITPDVIISDDELKSVLPHKRNCYFQGEKQLKYFKIYTRRNCEMECLATYYLENNRTNCVPYYIIRNETTPMCSIKKDHDIKFQKYFFLLSQHRKGIAYVDTCGCLDTCNHIKYSVNIIESKINEKLSDRDNATITITFRFKNDQYLPLIRRIAFGFNDFLSQAGGLLGLYAGISALSVVELLYFFTLRPIVNLIRLLKRKLCNK